MKILKRAALLAALLAGCGGEGSGGSGESAPSGPERELRAEVQWARRTLDDVNTNTMAGLAFTDIAEQGGTILTYVAANLPDNRPSAPIHYESGPPSRPWAVVVRNGSAAGEYLVEGYGENLSAPLCTERVVISFQPRR